MSRASRRSMARFAAWTSAALVASCASTEPVLKPGGEAERSKAAFVEMAKVLTHPRCINCHPSGDSPTQGDALEAHDPPVVRGGAGMGVPGMRCSTCHTESNVPLLEGAGSVPGAPTWQLAPASMAFQGKSPRALCELLKQLAGDGGASLEDIWKRNGTDPLTGWAWSPGDGRTSPPGTQADFARHTRVWIDGGAHCPDG